MRHPRPCNVRAADEIRESTTEFDARSNVGFGVVRLSWSGSGKDWVTIAEGWTADTGSELLLWDGKLPGSAGAIRPGADRIVLRGESPELLGMGKHP